MSTEGMHESVADVEEVSVDRIQARLGFAEPLHYPESWRNRPVDKWTIDADDVILRYVFRNFQPRRHLEFGTWAGDGVVRCVEECAATVWTINLLEGETRQNGDWAYADSSIPPASAASEQLTTADATWVRTDAFDMIGRKYLERGYGTRVCQIFADSRAWDTRHYPDGFFDSVFIDGGHAVDVVQSDTRKALRLTRRGGLMMWHDFCPLVEATEFSSSASNVVAAIGQLRHELAASVEALFWIRPSWILIGVRH